MPSEQLSPFDPRAVPPQPVIDIRVSLDRSGREYALVDGEPIVANVGETARQAAVRVVAGLVDEVAAVDEFGRRCRAVRARVLSGDREPQLLIVHRERRLFVPSEGNDPVSAPHLVGGLLQPPVSTDAGGGAVTGPSSGAAPAPVEADRSWSSTFLDEAAPPATVEYAVPAPIAERTDTHVISVPAPADAGRPDEADAAPPGSGSATASPVGAHAAPSRADAPFGTAHLDASVGSTDAAATTASVEDDVAASTGGRRNAAQTPAASPISRINAPLTPARLPTPAESGSARAESSAAGLAGRGAEADGPAASTGGRRNAAPTPAASPISRINAPLTPARLPTPSEGGAARAASTSDRPAGGESGADLRATSQPGRWSSSVASASAAGRVNAPLTPVHPATSATSDSAAATSTEAADQGASPRGRRQAHAFLAGGVRAPGRPGTSTAARSAATDIDSGDATSDGGWTPRSLLTDTARSDGPGHSRPERPRRGSGADVPTLVRKHDAAPKRVGGVRRRQGWPIVAVVVAAALVLGGVAWSAASFRKGTDRPATSAPAAASVAFPGVAPAGWSAKARWTTGPLAPDAGPVVPVGADAIAYVTASRSLTVADALTGAVRWRAQVPDGTVRGGVAATRIGGNDVLAVQSGSTLSWWTASDGSAPGRLSLPAGAKTTYLGASPLIGVDTAAVGVVDGDRLRTVKVPGGAFALAARADGVVTAAAPAGWWHLRADTAPGVVTAWDDSDSEQGAPQAKPSVVGYLGTSILTLYPRDRTGRAHVVVHTDREADVRMSFRGPVVADPMPQRWYPSPARTWGVLGRTLVDLKAGSVTDLGAWTTTWVTADTAYGTVGGGPASVGPGRPRGQRGDTESTPEAVGSAGAAVRVRARQGDGSIAESAYILPPD